MTGFGRWSASTPDKQSCRNPVFHALGIRHWSFERLDQTDVVAASRTVTTIASRVKGSLVHPVEGPAPAGLVKEVERGVECGTGSF